MSIDQYADRADERADFTNRIINLFPKMQLHRHYKGGVYEVITQGEHRETGDHFVAYRHVWPHDDPRVKLWDGDEFYGAVRLADGTLVARMALLNG